MNAAVVHEFGQPPRYEGVEEPEAGPDEVVVEMRAAALYQRVRGEVAGAHYSSDGVLPMIPGFDGVGRDPDGRRVFAVRSRPAQGTMAQRTLVQADQLLQLPDDLDDVTVAVLVNPAMSGWLALRQRARLQPGESVLVLGATGAAGSAAVQLARLLGADRVVGAGRDPAALQQLQSLGCAEVVSLAADDAEVRAELGRHAADVDVVIDYLWGAQTERALEALLRSRADRSERLRWVHVGAQAGPTISLQAAMLRQANLQVSGSGTGGIADQTILTELGEMFGVLAELAPVATPVPTPLADVERAWEQPLARGQRRVFLLDCA